VIRSSCGRSSSSSNASRRPSSPCWSALIESALFGHEAGALAGAEAPYPGAFERASGGTLFLDELNQLPLDLQPRLLRAIERGEIQRLRGHAPVRVDVRVVAATAVDMKALVEQAKFRDDLYYRLAEIRIDLPPLKDRVEDVPALVDRFFQKYGGEIAETGSKARGVSQSALAQLQRYSFPGNVRELFNALRRGVAVATGEEISVADLPSEVSGSKGPVARGPASGSQVLLLDASDHIGGCHIMRRGIMERRGSTSQLQTSVRFAIIRRGQPMGSITLKSLVGLIGGILLLGTAVEDRPSQPEARDGLHRTLVATWAPREPVNTFSPREPIATRPYGRAPIAAGSGLSIE
jgi:two-component system, NtrC family, response regulator AtoC